MRTFLQAPIPGALCALLAVSCSIAPDAPEAILAPTAISEARNPVARPFKMSRSNLQVAWAVERDFEVACGGQHIAGGATIGDANFTHLGRSTVEMSAAWNVGNLLDPAQVQFTPIGPAGGPVAPVLGPADYPYQFQFNPFTRQCGAVVSATGEVVLTAANGDRVFGRVVGGEAHRLDFVVPGDGAEIFAIIEIVGGTGRFAGARGGFVVHTVTRVDLATFTPLIEFAEVMPGGTIIY